MRLIKPLLVATLLMLSTNAAAAVKVVVEETYCDGLALMAKAGVEAKRRGESLASWQHNLKAMQSYADKHRDNLLFRILPRSIKDSDTVFRNKLTPTDTYVNTFNGCMAKDFGLVVTLN